jgi:hypothetical protein
MKICGREDPDMDPCSNANLIIDKIHDGEKTVSSINAAGRTG